MTDVLQEQKNLAQRMDLSREQERAVFPILGYAPGHYICTCYRCKQPFSGDKRAIECFPCAIEALRAPVSGGGLTALSRPAPAEDQVERATEAAWARSVELATLDGLDIGDAWAELPEGHREKIREVVRAALSAAIPGEGELAPKEWREAISNVVTDLGYAANCDSPEAAQEALRLLIDRHFDTLHAIEREDASPPARETAPSDSEMVAALEEAREIIRWWSAKGGEREDFLKKSAAILSNRPATGGVDVEGMRERAAKVAENGCLVPPDGGSPTEEERLMCEGIAKAIRSLPSTGASHEQD